MLPSSKNNIETHINIKKPISNKIVSIETAGRHAANPDQQQIHPKLRVQNPKNEHHKHVDNEDEENNSDP